MISIRSPRFGRGKVLHSLKRFFSFLALIILFFQGARPSSSFGQSAQVSPEATGVLSGFVLDYESRRGIADVRVILPAAEGPGRAERSAVTDKGGAFDFRGLPPGVYSCLFEREGYAPRAIEKIRIAAISPTRLEVELVRIPEPLREEVTVTAEAGRDKVDQTAGAVSIEGERLRQTPGSVDDVSRIIKSTVGMSQVNDLSNELIVRGGSPWENAFYVDQIPFYDINHYQVQGGSGGLVGVINASWVRSLNFFKGGFPASFGDRMSSVIEMAFREGERERVRGQVDLNTAGFGGGVEGPIFRGRGSFLFSVKRSYHDIITKMLGYGVAPRFGDVHFKAVVDLGVRHRLELLNVNADSRLSYDAEKAVEMGFTRALNYNTYQNTAGLCWYAGWSDHFSSVTSLSWSRSRNANQLLDSVTDSAAFLFDEIMNIAGLRHVGRLVFGDRFQVSFGFETKVELYDFNNTYGSYVNPYAELIPKILVRGDLKIYKTALFANLDWRPARPLTFSLGARLDHLSHNRTTEASPRLSAAWAITPRFTLKAAAGVFRQAVPTAILGITPRTRNNRNPYSIHYLLGVSHDVSPQFRWTLDIYDKQYHRLPLTPEDPEFSVFDDCLDYGIYRSFTTVNDNGLAYCRGLEVVVEKKPGGTWHLLVGASVFRSRFRDVLGRWRDRLNDNRYVMTAIGGLRIARKWNLGLRWDLAGGVPYTPYDIERSTTLNAAVLDLTYLDSRRYPDYSSVSFRLDREFRFKTSVLLAYLSILNLLDRENIARYYWNRVDNKLDIVPQAPILPVFGLEYRF
ncbi:MAG: TonB-dependent receptor [Candidatus Aminicenantales bacterium]